MKIKQYITILFFILMLPVVYSSYTLDMNIPVYFDFNENEYINATLLNSGVKVSNITSCLQITYNDGAGTTYITQNMTYANDTSMGWYAGFIESTEEKDIDFNITAFSNADCTTAVTNYKNGSMKFRVPFNITIKFYKGFINQNLSEQTVPYCNEFQYVGFMPYNKSASSNPITDLNYLDNMFGWMPFYEDSFEREFDNRLVLWDDYAGCQAKVKLYESSNYTIMLITSDVRGFIWNDEWHFPQFDDEFYKSEIKEKLLIENEYNQIISVVISAWEISKFRFMMNIFLWVVIIGIWLLGSVLSSMMGWKAIAGWTLGYFTILKIIGIVVI